MKRWIARLQAFAKTQSGRTVTRDAAVSIAAGYAVFQASGEHLTYGALTAAGMAALKLFLRKVVPDLWPADTAGISVKGKRRKATAPTAGHVHPSLPAGVHHMTSGPVAYTAPRPVAVPARHPSSTVIVIPEFHSPAGGRLGRHINHDPRSRRFRVTRQAATLRSVRHHRRVGIYDQGDLGSCVPHAGKGVLSTAPFRHRFSSEPGIIATYVELTAGDDIPGRYLPGAPDSEDTGSDGLSFAKLAVRHGWCSSYQHAFGITDALDALQRTAVMTGVNWYEGMDRPDATGLVAIAGHVRGGHELEFDEYLQRGTVPNAAEDLVGFDQSWGLGWGLHGRGYMTVHTWATLLEQDGDATALVP